MNNHPIDILHEESKQMPKLPKQLTAKTFKHRIVSENFENPIPVQAQQKVPDSKTGKLNIRLNTTKLIAQPISVLHETKQYDNKYITTKVERVISLSQGLCFNKQSYSRINRYGLSKKIDVLEYVDLHRKVIYEIQPTGLCKSKNCQVRREWVRLLRSQIESGAEIDVQESSKMLQNSAIRQIKNDIVRTFNEALATTCQVDLKHVHYLERTLEQVLISYAKMDSEVEYVQGMNMVAGVIVNHLRQLNISSKMFEFIMRRHGLRDLYFKQFSQLKDHCEQLYHRHLKNIALDIYQHLNRQNIQPITFLPPWLLSLFSCIIPINYMHLVIDGYIASGFAFVYRLALCYIIFLRQYIMSEKDQSIMILGSTYSRKLQVCWPELIAASERVPLL